MSIIDQLSEPLFAKPFLPNFIIDIMTGKVKVIMALNFDSLIEEFNKFGVNAHWLSEKETMKRKQQTRNIDGFVTINNKAISIKSSNGEEMTLFGGVISKILYDNLMPRSYAIQLASTYANHSNNS